eukprot:431831-Amphidinium_carterae.1
MDHGRVWWKIRPTLLGRMCSKTSLCGIIAPPRDCAPFGRSWASIRFKAAHLLSPLFTIAVQNSKRVPLQS